MQTRNGLRLLGALTLSALLLPACGQAGSDKAPAASDAPAGQAQAGAGQVIATVNGKDITMQDLRDYMQLKQAAGKPVGNPAVVLNELINRELVRQDAEKAGIPDRPDFQRALENERTNLLVSPVLSDRLKDVDLSDEALRKEYDKQVKDADLTEYKARHILLKSKAEAEAVIRELEKGADFAELARKKSTGPSANSGGDLGWFGADAMVPEFAAALKKMKKGEFTREPVKTQFGWHVIRLEDTRKVPPPAFEASKERLKSILANRAVQDYLSKLRASAKIEIHQPGHDAGEARPAAGQ